MYITPYGKQFNDFKSQGQSWEELIREQILFRVLFKKSAEWATARIEAGEHASAKIETDERTVGIRELSPDLQSMERQYNQ